jgi:hypothetical protein
MSAKHERKTNAISGFHVGLWISAWLSFSLSAVGQENSVVSAWIAGTYSSFEFNEEGGDLNGIEIRLIPVPTGFKAVVQFAQGEPQDVALVDATVAGSRVRFVLSDGSFDGVVSPKGLEGMFKYKSGASKHVSLHRGSSYWDKRAQTATKPVSNRK